MKFFVIKLRHAIIAAAACAAAAFICAVAVKTISVFNVNGREIPIYSVERSDSKIAVTFDCAWNDDDIDSILDTLDKYSCKAAFFVVGDWAKRYPESLKKISDRGHEIGNHSYNHADYTKMSEKEIIADLDKCDEIVESVTGTRPYLMRAPSGGYNNTVVLAARRSGRTYIQWSVDSIDYGDAACEDIYRRCVEKTKAGDILLFHNGTANTAKILPKILEALECRYEFAPLSDFIYKDNYIIDNTGRQIKETQNK